MARKVYTSGVIGLGKIGLGDDLHATDPNQVLTHSKAFYKSEHFDLVAGCDPSHIARRDFENAFQKPSFSHHQEFLASTRPQILAIATPTQDLLPTLIEVLEIYNPLLVLIEKPLTYNSKALAKILQLQIERNLSIQVNFTRDQDKSFRTLERMLKNSSALDPFVGNCFYSRGFLNNASHMINFLSRSLGAPNDFQVLKSKRFGEFDYDLDFFIQFGGSRIYFQSLPEPNISIFTLDLVNSENRYQLKPNKLGTSVTKFMTGSKFSNMKILSDESIEDGSTMEYAQLQMVDFLADVLNENSLEELNWLGSLEILGYMHRMIESLNG
jgi:hypothetical protein